MPTATGGRPEVARYRANRQKEIDGAALYRALAAATAQPALAEVYRRLGAAEEAHAGFWEERLRAAGAPVEPARPGWRPRALGWLARRFGPGFVLPAVAAAEQADSRGYAGQADAERAGLATDETSHARVLRALVGGTSGGLVGPQLAQLEGRHRAAGGNALRAAVLGANDGLVSNLSLVMGVAGAELAGQAVLVTGLAGLLAGAASMALGEWLSVQSARELAQRQLAVEAAEVEAAPHEEQEELALIYQAKGLPEAEANAVAARMMADRGTVLDTLAREELGIDPESLGGSAWEAAATSFFLFAAGAIIPVLPFLALTGPAAIAASLALSAVALFAVGAGITLLTGRSVLFSGARQVLFGLAAAALTFGIGRLIGVSLAG
jgi:VIT1/CCC1 family predicted Fe2+/Mn2+ transporter